MADQRRYAEIPLMRDLAAGVDNMLRAIEAAEKSGGSARAAGRLQDGRSAV